jgi:hypothetical protein
VEGIAEDVAQESRKLHKFVEAGNSGSLRTADNSVHDTVSKIRHQLRPSRNRLSRFCNFVRHLFRPIDTDGLSTPMGRSLVPISAAVRHRSDFSLDRSPNGS